MKNRNIIGENLKYYRKINKLSQEKFIGKLHLSGLDLDRTSLSRIENLTREVYDYELIFFSKILNISILDLYKNIPTDYDNLSK